MEACPIQKVRTTTKTKNTRSEELNFLVFSYNAIVYGACFLCIGISSKGLTSKVQSIAWLFQR
ncbi:transmembrane protein, putative [Medicago truncatula]|uniref:Transmembrane protein, putative n=1 Tax=Medicago truncatula TaxID=3880 RepID=G7IRU0_MEDTR|nr:transmembrane protein, putative [Medicago truncatula]